MRRWIGRLGRLGLSFVYWTVTVVVALLFLVVLASQVLWVQRWTAALVEGMVASQYGVRVSLERVSLSLPLRVTLHDAVVYDLAGDTLIAAGELSSSLRSLGFGRPSVGLGATRWVDGYMRMHTDASGQSRLKEVLERFKSRKPKQKKSAFELSISDIELRNVRYALSRTGARRERGRVDFKHLDLSDLHGNVRYLRVASDSIRLHVEGVRCRERSGMVLEDVGCRLSINPHHIYLGDLQFRHGLTSVHMPMLRFGFDGWGALSDFVNRVDIEARLASSVVHTSTVGYFMPLPGGEGFSIEASGHVQGRCSDLRVSELVFSSGDSTHLALSGELIGLPDVHSTVVSINFERLTTSLRDVELLALGLSNRRLSLSTRLAGVGRMEYGGNLTGFLDNFVAYGNLKTDLGNLRLDMGLEYDSLRNVRFRGQVQTQRFDLRGLMRDTLWGTITGHARVDGLLHPGGDFTTEVFSHVDSIGVFGHYYRDAQFKGLATNRSYAGAFSVRDTALRMSFDGVIDLADNNLPYFRFATQVDRADLHAMHIDRSDSISVLAALVDVDFQGDRLDDLDGSITVEELSYTNSRGRLSTGNARIEASQEDGKRKLVFFSPFAQASLETADRYDAVAPSIKRLIYHHVAALMPDLQEEVTDFGEVFDYAAEFTLDSVAPICQVLYPAVYIAPRTFARLEHRAGVGRASFRFTSDSIAYKGYSAAGINLQMALEDAANMGQFTSDRFWWGRRMAREASMRFRMMNGEYWVGLRMVDGAQDSVYNALELNTVGKVGRDSVSSLPYTVLRIDSSRLLLNRDPWIFSRARIRVDRDQIAVSNFHLNSAQQRFSLSGRLSRSLSDTLVAQLSAVDLSQFSTFVPQANLRGTLRGTVRLWNPFSELGLRMGIDVQDLRVNELYMGHFKASALWAGLEKPFEVHASNVSLEGHEDIRADFQWFPSAQKYAATLAFHRFDLASLHILTQGRALPQGYVSGSLSSSGTFQKPQVDGVLAFHEAGAYISELNSTFTTSSSAQFKGSQLRLERFALRDAMGGQVELSGTIDYSTLRNPVFDVRLASSAFQLINTNSFGQRLYYGHLVSALQAQAAGSLADLSLDVQLQALPSSNVTVQLPSSAEATQNRHLIFTSTLSDMQKGEAFRQRETTLSPNLRLNMSLSLTNDAQVQLVLNSRTGDMIRARGDANLRITSDPVRNTLQIFGDYTLQRGEMQFTWEGLLSKRFRIAQGSTIRFAGSPMQAYADIETIYSTRASLDRLIGASDQEKYKRRIPVDCKLFFRGPLASPKLAFAIDVPQADAETRSQLTAALNTEEKKMRQFASLLLINSFIPDSRLQSQVAGTGDNTASAGVTGQEVILSSFGELVSNQFNSWLAQIGQSSSTPLINLGFNYRPSAYDAELDEAEVSFSMQWKSFNVDANWEVNRHNTSNAIAGDINITKQSSLLDNLQYKAFARSNDDLIFRDLKPYTAGAGVVYSDTFNDWREFVAKLKAIFRRKRKAQTEEGGGE